MIITLTAAIKNVGDYLIGDRARKLVKAFVDPEAINMDRLTLTEADLPQLNKARAILLCGGPALRDDAVPKVYPGVLEKVDVPMLTMGVGWSGQPMGHPEQFKFNDRSEAFIRKIHDRVPYTTVRDDITQSIMERYGFNTKMSGCPAWYDLRNVEKDFEFRSDIKSLVFSTPAVPSIESLKVMRAVAKRFPNATKYCCFHRGILPDKLTTLKAGFGYSTTAALAVALGYKVVDAAYDLSKIDFYDDLDMHIGYRVHAHIYFLSRRAPSFLINEDGRGQGQAKSLGLYSLDRFQPDLVDKLNAQIDSYFASKGADHAKAVQNMKQKFSVMKEFLGMVKGL